MSRITLPCVAALLMGLLCSSLHAQRAGSGSATKAPGAAAKVIYRQDFDDEGGLDSFYKALGHGNHTDWIGDGAGAFGSKGAIKITSAGGNPGCERYLDWKDENTTIAFMIYPHGVKSAYLMGHGAKAGKNIRAYFPITAQDQWQLVRVKASAFSNGTPGESFRNLLFLAEEWDPNVKDAYFLLDKIVIFSGDDGQPPSAGPREVKVTWFEKNKAASINFSPAADDVGVYLYDIHRSESAAFEPTRETRIARVNDTYFEDKSVEAGKTYYYRIAATDVGGFAVTSDPVKYDSENNGAARVDVRGLH